MGFHTFPSRRIGNHPHPLSLSQAHWHGNTVVFRGYRTDVIELFPGTMAVADMTADNIGLW